jgi:hypothetical protein
VPFYRKLGYVVVGRPFMEVGIPHRAVRKRLHSRSVNRRFPRRRLHGEAPGSGAGNKDAVTREPRRPCIQPRGAVPVGQ